MPDTLGSTRPPGDLVRARSLGGTRVGILVDDIPTSIRSQFVSDMRGKPEEWWIERARYQLRLTTYKLRFLSSFYPTYKQLMLPVDPEAITITFTGPADYRRIGGNEVVSRPYRMETYIVARAGTAAGSAPELGRIGASLNIPFTLPVDPYLLIQRTGFDCMDDSQFPGSSLDPRNAHLFYDDSCLPGEPGPPNQPCSSGCHCSYSANLSCVDSLAQNIGSTVMNIFFARMAWNETIARRFESLSAVTVNTSRTGADLVGNVQPGPGMANNWVIYRYFTPESCEAQNCILQPGWRKLLVFDGVQVNVGTRDLFLGLVPYTANNPVTFDPRPLHNMFYWGACQGHPQFAEYSQYVFDPQGDSIAAQGRGFCVQSTTRIVNDRSSPLWSPYQSCLYQGISIGWGSNHHGGIPCQWVDVTPVLPRAPRGISTKLRMVGNPANWMCEGTINNDSRGQPKWTGTGFNTISPPWPPQVAGQPVDVYDCTASQNAQTNNVLDYSVAVPLNGYGAITDACVDGGSELGQVYGPSRDCDFMPLGSMLRKCRAGRTVRLSCTVPRGAPIQVIRVCESSIALSSGTACRFLDPFTLANDVVGPLDTGKLLTFTCPTARDGVELGGFYSLYIGLVYSQNGQQPADGARVSCTVLAGEI